MAVHFSLWLLLLVSTAFMASYMQASASVCSKSCKKFSRSMCKSPQCDRSDVDLCKLCKKEKKKICLKLMCRGKDKVAEGSCGNPGNVNGASRSDTTYTYGAMVTYTCNTGYELTAGVTTLTCSNNRTWIGTKPTCSKVSCGSPGYVSAASQSGTTYTYRAKVTYTCITGYEMAGGNTLICGSNKTWSGAKPTCSKVSCGNPGNASLSSRKGTTYTYGANVTYRCIISYEHFTLTCGSNKEWIGTKPNCSSKQIPKGKGCADLYQKGIKQSGVYQIKPFSSGAKANQVVSVYCDMTTDGGGWMVFQRRIDGSVDFYRNWENYTNGFGNVDGEYWLGFDAIHALTADRSSVLRVDLWDFGGKTAYAKYSYFSVWNSLYNYQLEIRGYSGTASDSLSYHSGRPFTTYDRDNDPCTSAQYNNNCAPLFHGAWWYGYGAHSNLNGRYYNSEVTKGLAAIYWYYWKSDRKALKRTEMKLRPSNFKSG